MHRTELPPDIIMELLEICVNSYFQEGKRCFYSRRSAKRFLTITHHGKYLHGMVWRTLCPPEVLRLCYVDGSFIICQHSTDTLQLFFQKLNDLKSAITFTMETEKKGSILCIDVNSISVQEINTRRYMNCHSNHSQWISRRVHQPNN